MRNVRRLLVAVLACLPVVALGAISPGVGSFSKQVSGTDRRVPITSASFADKVFFEILIVTTDGEHPLHVTIYDGSGREVYNSESILVATRARAGAAISYGFNPTRDAPGTWWYVAALDGEIKVSKSLQVSATP